jgi:hypothetical protein
VTFSVCAFARADVDRQAGAYELPRGKTDLTLSLGSWQEEQAAEDKVSETAEATDAQDEGEAPSDDSLEEINNKLNNPGSDLAQLTFRMFWYEFEGNFGGHRHPQAARDLRRLRQGGLRHVARSVRGFLRRGSSEGPSSQDSFTVAFQPVFPFSLKNGDRIIVRPTIPITWQPVFNGKGGYDEEFGIADALINAFYARTDAERGIMWGMGLASQFPTHTDDALGKDQLRLGPAGFFGLMGEWGSTGIFPQHLWNVCGTSDGYTSQTQIQIWYWFNVGDGYQVGGSPLLIANWDQDDSDDIWTIPFNLGAQKTVMIGKLPIRFRLEGMYFLEQPDSFGPHWGLQLTVTPVIPNPFEALASR